MLRAGWTLAVWVLAIPLCGASNMDLVLEFPSVGTVPPEVIPPGKLTTIPATARIAFGEDASCGTGLPFRAALHEPLTNVSVWVDPPNGTVPPPEVRPGNEWKVPLSVNLVPPADLEAFTRIDMQIRLDTDACETLNATRVVSQTGTRVAFNPDVDIDLLSDDGDAWRLGFTSYANAPVRVVWSLVQPAAGRVLADGEELRLIRLQASVHSVPKSGFDPAAPVDLEATIHYAGNHTGEPPPPGQVHLRLHTPADRKNGTPGLTAGGVILLAGAVVVAARRRHL